MKVGSASGSAKTTAAKATRAKMESFIVFRIHFLVDSKKTELRMMMFVDCLLLFISLRDRGGVILENLNRLMFGNSLGTEERRVGSNVVYVVEGN
jgi:hypothetical protein